MIQKLFAEKEFPCLTNTLNDEDGDVAVMVYSVSETDLPAGLWLSTEGFYDMVFSHDTISRNDVNNSLKELSELSGFEYELQP